MTPLEKLLKELRERAARYKELRAKETLTDVEKEERKGLPDIIERLNLEFEEEKRAVALLASLDISIDEPPAGDDPETRSAATMADKPIYRSIGEQVQDVIVTGGGRIPGISDGEARKRLDANDKRSVEQMGTAASSLLHEVRTEAQSVKDSASGGGLVQTEFAFDLVERGFNNGAAVAQCTERMLSGPNNSVDIHGLDENSRKSGARYGGIQVFTKREMENYEATKANFAKITMKVDKITGLLYLSDEIMQDAAFLEGEISDLFPKAFAFKIQDLIFNGKGAGELLGIHNSKAMVTIAAESGQTAKTIKQENISNMKAAAMGQAQWWANRDIIPQLDTLYRVFDSQKVEPLFRQTSINNGTLDGIPITFIEQAETLGSQGDLVLADFSDYVILRKGNSIDRQESMSFKFDQGMKAIRWDLRIDGQSRLKTALTPYKGTNKTSSFVRLAVRS